MNAALSKGLDMKLFAPISKVDELTRTVGGTFTDDLEDSQQDIVEWEATKEAVEEYKNWRNIRAMHQPIAAGVASLIELDDQTHKGYLEAIITDDAEWKKCLPAGEGLPPTYKGWSIGGRIIDAYMDAQGIRHITKYQLTEVSLVDRPANPRAVLTVVKVDGEQPIHDPSDVDTHDNPDAREGDTDHDGEEDETEVGDKKTQKALDLRSLHKAAELSLEDITSRIAQMVRDNPGAIGLSLDEDAWVWVEATYDDSVILEVSGKHYRIGYTESGGNITLVGQVRSVHQEWTDDDPAPGTGTAKADTTPQPDATMDPQTDDMGAGPHKEPDGDEITIKFRKGDGDSDDAENQALHNVMKAMGAMCGCAKCQKAAGCYDEMEPGMGKAEGAGEEGAGDEEAAKAESPETQTEVGKEAAPETEEEEKPVEAAKAAAGSSLTKADLSSVLTKAIADAGLAKAEDVQRLQKDLAKATEAVAELKGKVKALEDAPADGGPVVRKPGSGPVEKGGSGQAPDEKATLLKALEEEWSNTNDPMVKDAIGRRIANLMHPARG